MRAGDFTKSPNIGILNIIKVGSIQTMRYLLRRAQIKSALTYLELYFHTSANPHHSVTRVIVTKIRVIVEWSLRRILELGIRRKALASLKSLKWSGTGREALVLANGPSLNRISLEEVAEAQKDSVDVFVVNFFPISDGTNVLIPNFLVLSDPATRPTSEDGRSINLWKWIDLHREVKIICPSSWFRTLRNLEFDLAQFIFFDDSSLMSWSKNISPVRARSYLSLTAYKALAVAVYFNYSEIDIIGIDNNQFKELVVNERNRIIQGPNHFTKYANDVDMTNRLPDGVADYFYDSSRAFSDLRKFSKAGIIWNLDPGSYVDAFPKKITSRFRVND